MHTVQAALAEVMDKAHDLVACWLCRGTKIGTWISMLPSTSNGTELGEK